MSAGLIIASISACSGAPGANTTLPNGATAANAIARAAATAMPTATAAPGSAVLGIAAPRFATALTGDPIETDPSGATLQSSADGTHTNIFRADGSFDGQLDGSQTGPNGLPLIRLTDASGKFVQVNVPDVSSLPDATPTALGDVTVTVAHASGMVSIAAWGQSFSGVYDPNSNTVAITNAAGTVTTVAASAAIVRSVQGVRAKQSATTCAAAIALAIAASVTITLAIIAAASACAVLAGSVWGWPALAACLTGLAHLIAAAALIMASIIALENECATPSPAPPPGQPAPPSSACNGTPPAGRTAAAATTLCTAAPSAS